MTFNTQKFLAGTIALVLVMGMTSPSFAQSPGDMYGSVDRSSVDPGSIVIVDQNNGLQTFLGDPNGDVGMAGLAFDSSVRLFGSTVRDGQLIEIDPSTGGLIGVIGTFTDSDTGAFIDRMTDLAYQASSDTLYGVFAGSLYTIDKTNAEATLVGSLPAIVFGGGLAFAPDGTLYLTSATIGDGVFQTIDPDTGSTILDIGTDLEFDALGIRSDGTIFAARGGASGFPADIYTIDPTTGATTFVGTDSRGIADLDFLPGDVTVGGINVPIDTSALLIGGLTSMSLWMIPTVLGLAGAGIYLVKFRANRE